MNGSVPLSSEPPYQEQLEAKIEDLRQQLATMTADRDDCLALAKLNFAKWLDSQRHGVMLRDALSKIEYLESDNGSILSAGACSSIATEALAATEADLGGLILCEKEPVAEVDIADGFYWADICEDQIVKVGERLYRAKEQGK